MNGFQGTEIFYAPTVQNEQEDFINNNGNLDLQQAKQDFMKFISEFRKINEQTYQDQLIHNNALQDYKLQVNLDDLLSFFNQNQRNQDFTKRPSDYIPVFEEACKQVIQNLEHIENQNQVQANWHVQIYSDEHVVPLRQLSSVNIGKLITVSGIIVNSSRSFIKGKTIAIQCKQCSNTKYIEAGCGLDGIVLPRICTSNQENQQEGRENCPKDPYFINPDNCSLIDQQILRIQEENDSVPAGEIPRTFQICADRKLCNKLIPGSRVTITGVYSIIERSNFNAQRMPGQNLKMHYIHMLGIAKENSFKKITKNFTEEEILQFQNFARSGTAYTDIAKLIAPSIYGNDEIKKAIACLMFGGSRKILPDKMKLRGDINVLLIGDPSTGKSQFLKFVEKTAPIAIYTSGKGLSAAGLTASVNKDPSTGEFQIEGGAMVLGDGGIVCIDEFDKMRPEDRVSIHEAMEQQTISIAKAGLTAKLNSRVSVLAAANPMWGSYKDSQSISNQIDLQTTILSRFDCIFIVRDHKVKDHDILMAKHILDLHQNREVNLMEAEMNQFVGINNLKRYIAYAKQRCHPRLTEQSARQIQQMYVSDRSISNSNSKNRGSNIPVTVRQLEAIIRLSESIARIELSESVEQKHIDEAHRLFQNSTLLAINQGLDVAQNVSKEMQSLIEKIEQSILKRVALNGRYETDKLKLELLSVFNNEKGIDFALRNLIRSNNFEQKQQGKVIQRIK